MDKQVIIAISREYGSGGHYIAAQLAKRFEYPVYDHNLLDEMCVSKGLDPSLLSRYDEVPKNKLLSRRVRGISNSPEEAVAEMQFDFLREKADSGESFVVVGRCAEHILRDYSGLISFFVIADTDAKIQRLESLRNMSQGEAEAAMARHDSRRRAYHNHYCDIKWGDSRHYDLCINSSRLGIEKTLDLLENYIKERKLVIQ